MSGWPCATSNACGRCARCRAGGDHLCDAPLGFLAFTTDGGFAEQLVVPASAVVPVPDGLELTEAASPCCSATTALHATTAAEVGEGDTAVVYGVWGVGLALVQVLRRAGARVIAVARGDAAGRGPRTRGRGDDQGGRSRRGRRGARGHRRGGGGRGVRARRHRGDGQERHWPAWPRPQRWSTSATASTR